MAIPAWRMQQQLRELIAKQGKPVSAKELHELAMDAGLSGFPSVNDVRFVLACGTSDFLRHAGSPARWYLHPEDPLLSGLRRMADRERWPAEAILQSTSMSSHEMIRANHAATGESSSRDKRSRDSSETPSKGIRDKSGTLVMPVAARHSEQANKAAWDAVQLETLVSLSDIGTDVLRIRILSRNRSRTFFRLRLDYVGPPAQPEIWMSGGSVNQALMRRLLRSAPSVLSPGLQLPLIAPSSDATLTPTAFVWRLSSPHEAAEKFREVVGDHLEIHPSCLRTDKETCSPMELERRVGWDATVRRLRGRRMRKHGIVSFCDRCGQGLSDPNSVAIGIGPECLKYYSRDVLTAARHGDVQLLRTGAKLPKRWLHEVVQEWSHDQSRAARR
jgi:Family of unknown function (DUF6011)